MRLSAGWLSPSLVLVLFLVTLSSCDVLVSPKDPAQVAAPTFGFVSGPSGGVSLTTSTSGATIRYTLDGSTPSASAGLAYTNPIPLGVGTTTIKAIAFKSGWKSSQVVSQTFTIDPPPPSDKVATPIASVGGGSYSTAQSVSLSTTTEGASIYYTIDESAPTANTGTLYESPITISSDTILRAIAVKTGWDDSDELWESYLITPTLNPPSISPNGGTFAAPQEVTLTSDATGFFDIYYTLDGDEPTEDTGTLYDDPITISETSTIKAIVVKPNWNNSPVASASFTISLPQTVATPTISPNGGTFTSAQLVTLATTTPDATIYYTTNNDNPTTASTPYTGTFSVDANATVKAIAVKSGWIDSAIASASFTINLPQTVATPTISPNGGTFTSAQLVTLATTTPDATIYYTTNGNVPTTASTLYTGAFSVGANATVKAIAVKSGWIDSAIASASFTINTGSGGIAVTVQ